MSIDIPNQDSERGERAAGNLLLGEKSDTTPVLSVVIPTLNEKEGITECIEQIKSVAREIEIPTEVIVSDSSTDRTPEIARSMGAIIVEPIEKGYGRAYRTGFDKVRGRYVVMGDADTTYDFTAIPRLLEPVMEGDADICLGSRLDGEIKQGAMPALHKYVGNPLLTRFLNVFYAADVSDAHSGFRVLSRDALEQLELESDGMEFASEMIMRASEQGLRIEERPITYHQRKGDETLESFQDGWRHVKFMLVNAPSYLYFVPGAALVMAGVFLLGSAALGVQIGTAAPGTYALVTGGLLTVLGYQIGSLWVFSSVTNRPIRKPKDPISTWMKNHFRLKHGMTLGLVMIVFSGALSVSSFVSWVQTGFLPGIETVVVLLTVTIVGFQTIFSSFFLSTLHTQSR